jgi:hypothetical protein
MPTLELADSSRNHPSRQEVIRDSLSSALPEFSRRKVSEDKTPSRLQTLSEAIEDFAAQSAVEIHYEELRNQNELLVRRNIELEDRNYQL